MNTRVSRSEPVTRSLAKRIVRISLPYQLIDKDGVSVNWCLGAEHIREGPISARAYLGRIKAGLNDDADSTAAWRLHCFRLVSACVL